jgi:pantoate--beta-alanine ligase
VRVIEHIQKMRQWSESARCAGKSIAFVPTMGSLHEGHLSLVRKGRQMASRLVVSIFVNPAQFGPHEDYAAYPRDFERDCELLQKERVDLVFRPSVEEMYPDGFQTYVDTERLAALLCGGFRPHHFRGVATVVTKLFNIVQPRIAIFGEKDYQQLQIIKRLVRDLDLDVEIVSCPTVRDKDGLALSSRNFYLDPAERLAALSLSRALKKAQSLVLAGERSSEKILQCATEEIAKERLITIQYIRLCDPSNLEEMPHLKNRNMALLALAVRIGKARLIDNALLRT